MVSSHPEERWLRGGTPEGSRIVPWRVHSIGHEDIDFWQGRLESDLVNESSDCLVKEV